MSQKISQLPAVIAANIQDTDVLPLVATNITSKVTVANLRLKLGTTPPAAGRTVTSISTYLANNAVFNVKDYGAFGDAVSNDVAAINAAYAAAQTSGFGSVVYFPQGRYMVNSSPNPIAVDGVSVIGAGPGVQILAGANSVTLLKISASYCEVRNLQLLGGGWATITGLAVVPADETLHATRVDQNYNRFLNLHIQDCNDGVRMRCGPGTAAGDSGCWYNLFSHVDVKNTTRAYYLQSPVTNVPATGATAGSLVNRNTFSFCRSGQNMNVGFYIEAGGTNVFFHCSFEGIASGVTPLATPTAIWIQNTDSVSGFNNDNNLFFGTTNETNSRDIFNDNPYTEFHGHVSLYGAQAGAFPQGAYMMAGSYHKQKFFGATYDPQATFPGWTHAGALYANNMAKYSGKSGVIANAGTFDMVITNPRHPMLLMISHDGNLGVYGVWSLSGDGASNPTLNNIVNAMGGQFTIAVLNATTIRITNVSSGNVHFTWGVLPFGPAL